MFIFVELGTRGKAGKSLIHDEGGSLVSLGPYTGTLQRVGHPFKLGAVVKNFTRSVIVEN